MLRSAESSRWPRGEFSKSRKERGAAGAFASNSNEAFDDDDDDDDDGDEEAAIVADSNPTGVGAAFSRMIVSAR